jgi:hypothetical protein
MSNEYAPGRFSDVYATPTGKRLWTFLNQPETVARTLAACDLGKPAVAGLGTREELLEAVGDDISADSLKQTIGHMVRQNMESQGREMAVQGLKISIEGGESLFSKGTRYKRRLPHWGHLGMRGERDGRVVWGSLGADSVEHALQHLAGFSTMCSGAGIDKVVVKVRDRGTPASTRATRRIQIQASRTGSVPDVEKERLLSVLGKGPVAPNIDVEVTIG